MRRPPTAKKTSSPRLGMRAGFLVAATPAILLAACDDLRPFRPLGADLTLPSHTAIDQQSLAPVAIDTHAGLDALEASFTPRPGVLALLAFLEQTALRPGLDHPVVLQRIALLHADIAAVRGGGIDDVFKAGTRVREKNPTGPDTFFVEGYIPWRFMRPDDTRPLVISDELKAFAETARERWQLLVTRHPDWKGPRGLNAAAIRARLDELDVALDRLEVAGPAAQPAPAAPTSESPPAVALNTNQMRALDALRRFESAPDGERRGICSAWPAPILAAPDGPELARLALTCNRHEGRLVEAAQSLVTLAKLNGRTVIDRDLCREWLMLSERFGLEPVTTELARLAMSVTCTP